MSYSLLRDTGSNLKNHMPLMSLRGADPKEASRLNLSSRTKMKVEPTTGIEPVNLFLTKEVLYLLSYVGP
jgi:hypothetical protein